MKITRRQGSGIFKYSKFDGILVLLSLLQIAGVLFYAHHFQEFGLVGFVVSGLVMVYMVCLNYQCVSHNFIHNPFFRSKRLNRIFGILNSIPMGAPSTFNRIEHIIHHKYNNDVKGADGWTKDNLSIFRHGEGDKPESFLTYSIFTPFRIDMGRLYRSAPRQISEESLALAAFIGLVFYIEPLAVVWWVLFSFLGLMASAAENYCEHVNATPGDRARDSVSCYNPYYNFLWFNNGYHQEHHFRPGVHWMDVPKVKALLPPEDGRYCVPFCHFVNYKRVQQ